MRHQGSVVVIDHVPAEVGPVCGDVLFQPETIRALDRLLATMPQPDASVGVDGTTASAPNLELRGHQLRIRRHIEQLPTVGTPGWELTTAIRDLPFALRLRIGLNVSFIPARRHGEDPEVAVGPRRQLVVQKRASIPRPVKLNVL